MNPVGRLNDGRLVTLTRVNYNDARVAIGTETVGHVRTESKPHRDAVTTQFVNARYGEQIARSIGFGNQDKFIALDTNRRRINNREYDRIEAAAMAVGRATRP